jgi:hypothetical protein
VRYMNASGARKKFKTELYIRKWLEDNGGTSSLDDAGTGD